MDITMLSSKYSVRRLGAPDAGGILRLCAENTQFYRYSEAKPSMEQVLGDLTVTPPGVGPSDKYYIGFFRGNELIAVMDLIDGYPEPDTVFIGFFMMKKALQRQRIGSGIIREAAAYLKNIGKRAIRLGIDKGNPQAEHFWKKNGFIVIYEAERDGHAILAAEKTL